MRRGTWHACCIATGMNHAEAARRFIASLKLGTEPARAIDIGRVVRLQQLERLLRQTCQAFERVCREQLHARARMAELEQRIEGLERSQARAVPTRTGPASAPSNDKETPHAP